MSYVDSPVQNQDFNQVQAPAYSNDQYLNNAYADPKYMAFKRAMGASNAVAQAEAAQQISSARQGQQNLPQEYADMLGQSLRKISDQFENQGMYSSSNRLRSQNEQQGALEGQMLGQRNAYQDQINNANIGLAKQLAQGQMQNAENMIQGADNTIQEGAQYGINPFGQAARAVSSRTGVR